MSAGQTVRVADLNKSPEIVSKYVGLEVNIFKHIYRLWIAWASEGGQQHI